MCPPHKRLSANLLCCFARQVHEFDLPTNLRLLSPPPHDTVSKNCDMRGTQLHTNISVTRQPARNMFTQKMLTHSKSLQWCTSNLTRGNNFILKCSFFRITEWGWPRDIPSYSIRYHSTISMGAVIQSSPSSLHAVWANFVSEDRHFATWSCYGA